MSRFDLVAIATYAAFVISHTKHRILRRFVLWLCALYLFISFFADMRDAFH